MNFATTFHFVSEETKVEQKKPWKIFQGFSS